MSEIADFSWLPRREFLNRTGELRQLEVWWADGRNRLLVNLYGRRRVGKSWLLRAFADGKPAVVLVAEQIAEGAQLARFAAALEPYVGVRPDLPDVPALFRVLYELGREQKVLVAIDEFPYLLPVRPAARQALLTAIQAQLEDLTAWSQTKLMLCGSHVAQMEGLLGERSPLRGRMQALSVRSLRFDEARPFLSGLDAVTQIERYGVAGGMPRYLTDLATPEDLRTLVCRHVLDRHSALYNEPRELLEQELQQPSVYFSILEALAGGDKGLGEIGGALRMTGPEVSRYLDTLREFRIVERRLPITAPSTARRGNYHLRDPFFRFWFRFNFPFQGSLDAGLPPEALYDDEIAPFLNDHVAGVLEELARQWLLRNHGTTATQVGGWWGLAARRLRTSGERSSEEIDVVGLKRNRVTLVGECKWTTGPLGLDVLRDLERYKLPALAEQARLASALRIVLFSRAGFGDRLAAEARRRDDLLLVGPDELVAGSGE